MGLLINPDYVVSGLGHAESVVVIRHLTPCWTTAAGHTNSLTRIRKTHHNTLKGLHQHSHLSGSQGALTPREKSGRTSRPHNRQVS